MQRGGGERSSVSNPSSKRCSLLLVMKSWQHKTFSGKNPPCIKGTAHGGPGAYEVGTPPTILCFLPPILYFAFVSSVVLCVHCLLFSQYSSTGFITWSRNKSACAMTKRVYKQNSHKYAKFQLVSEEVRCTSLDLLVARMLGWKANVL